MKQDVPAFEILIESVMWKKQKGLTPRLRRAVAATLAHLPPALRAFAQQTTWTVLLTTDAAIHKLNRDFRKKDKPTNVLSFPQFSAETLRRILKHNVFEGACLEIGDIAVSSRYVFREAKAEGKDPCDHLTHLVIHGLLHLLGYDHETEAEAAKMEKLETRIMASLGLPDPYAQLPEVEPAKAISPAKIRSVKKSKGIRP